jgi:hypothetical protein
LSAENLLEESDVIGVASCFQLTAQPLNAVLFIDSSFDLRVMLAVEILDELNR